MQSAFSGIELGKRSLFAHSRGLQTVGHNLGNASVEGYSRQRVHFAPTDPLYRPQLNRANTPGQIGQGVDIVRIERVRDMLLEGRIVSQSSDQGYWESRNDYIRMLEQVYNEPTDVSVRTLMDRFWDSWQELSLFPEQISARQQVLSRGQGLVEAIQLRYQSLEQIRSMLQDEIRTTVAQVNVLTREIAALNREIVKVEAAGDNPNDWRDQRDLRVEELSRLIDVTINTSDPDEFNVHTGGRQLVQGGVAIALATERDPLNEGFSRVTWAQGGETARFASGKLAALVELRDVDIREEIQGLDNMAVNFVDLVNEVHRGGYGLDGSSGRDFFVEYPFVANALGNYDRNGDGQFDSSYIFRITGTNRLDPQQQIGLAGTMTLSGPRGIVTIDYSATDTVADVVNRINFSASEVVARIDGNGRLTLKAAPAETPENPDFVIRYVEDTGQFLVGYAGILQAPGPDNAFSWDQPDAVNLLRGGDLEFAVAPLAHPSGWIGVNPDLVRQPAAIAASLGDAGRPGNPGDGSAALRIASIRNQPVMVGQIYSFDDYFADSVATVALKGSEAEISLATQNAIMKDLTDTRASISGVNIDEEIAQMIKFQHGYAAAARFISEVDRMLDTIINRMGV
ncbi:MAG: flagellar hook-associated protein FlgK [Spirochaetaceae bacterium]|nr:MAG: flagellar hook-associated protein FlgK [Spirochaetaceae bacterium]